MIQCRLDWLLRACLFNVIEICIHAGHSLQVMDMFCYFEQQILTDMIILDILFILSNGQTLAQHLFLWQAVVLCCHNSILSVGVQAPAAPWPSLRVG